MEQQESDLDAALHILRGMRELAESHNAEWDEIPTWIGSVLLDELARLRAVEGAAREFVRSQPTLDGWPEGEALTNAVERLPGTASG